MEQREGATEQHADGKRDILSGGLFTSTLLTLFVVPVVSSLADGARSRINRRRAQQHDAAAPTPIETGATGD